MSGCPAVVNIQSQSVVVETQGDPVVLSCDTTPVILELSTTTLSLEITPAPTILVEVGVQGPSGPQGPVGPQGPQGDPGPQGPPGVGADSCPVEAAAALSPGQPVYVQTDGRANLAQADALPQARLWGIATTSAAIGFTSDVVLQGIVTLTAAEWDAVTGQVGGLTTGSTYWLDPSTAGMLTTTPPTTQGSFCTFVGKAIDSTKLDLDPRSPIRL